MTAATILLAAATALAGGAERAGVESMLAVLDAEIGPGVDPALAGPFTDSLIGALVRTGEVRVVDRAHRDQILAEQGLQLDDCTSRECRVEIGQLLGVGRLVTAKVTRLGARYFATAQIVRVETGEIVASGEVRCDCAVEQLPDRAPELASQLLGHQLLAVAAADLTIQPRPTLSLPAGAERALGPDEREELASSGMSLPDWLHTRMDRAEIVRNVGIGGAAIGGVAVLTGFIVWAAATEEIVFPECDFDDACEAQRIKEERARVDTQESVGGGIAIAGALLGAAGVGAAVWGVVAHNRYESLYNRFGGVSLAPAPEGATVAWTLRF